MVDIREMIREYFDEGVRREMLAAATMAETEDEKTLPRKTHARNKSDRIPIKKGRGFGPFPNTY